MLINNTSKYFRSVKTMRFYFVIANRWSLFFNLVLLNLTIAFDPANIYWIWLLLLYMHIAQTILKNYPELIIAMISLKNHILIAFRFLVYVEFTLSSSFDYNYNWNSINKFSLKHITLIFSSKWTLSVIFLKK